MRRDAASRFPLLDKAVGGEARRLKPSRA